MSFHRRILFSLLLTLGIAMPDLRAAEEKIHTAHLKDVTSVEGIRDNLLMGYGLVAGLNGTGDRQQTIFSTQTLANMLQRMGVTVSPTTMLVHNIAAVFVTATLPPFARPGMRIDATISSIGDAKTLVIHPASTTHQQMDAAQLKAAGLGEELVRLSVGIEAASDIIDDLGQALHASQKA